MREMEIERLVAERDEGLVGDGEGGLPGSRPPTVDSRPEPPAWDHHGRQVAGLAPPVVNPNRNCRNSLGSGMFGVGEDLQEAVLAELEDERRLAEEQAAKRALAKHREEKRKAKMFHGAAHDPVDVLTDTFSPLVTRARAMPVTATTGTKSEIAIHEFEW